MSETRTQHASSEPARPADPADSDKPAGSGDPAADLDLDVFLHRYLAHANSQLPGRSSGALLALARGQLSFAETRPAGDTLVRVVELDGERSAVQIVTADAPYLVDSVRAELARGGHAVDKLLHPQLVVARDPAGRLLRVYDLDDNADVPSDAITESWMHLEMGGTDAGSRADLVDDVRRVVTDVQLAVEDAPAMYRLIRSLADDLAADPGQFDAETSVEAGELLRWLADGNYMILGHAAYSANQLASPQADAAPSDVRGVLRGTTSISPLELLPAFRSGAPLVIFKSPLVSTVRRSVRYDCVTVVTPDGGSGQTVHVFLGLITTFEDGTVARVPVVRRRIAEILLRSGVRANSHSGRQLLAALRTLPRDELLEAPTADLLRLSQLVVARAEHGAVGVFARVHLNRDFVTVLVYFPAERFGPETTRKVRQTVLAAWPGELVARDDRIVELGLARMQFLIALPPGTPPASPDRQAIEAEIARVTRRWSDDFADLLTIAAGEDEAGRLLRRYGGAFPEAYKETFSAATAVRDVGRLEALRQDEVEREEAFDLYVPAPDDPADRRLKVFRQGRPVSLARALPIFSQMGIEVLDERPYEVERADGGPAWIYDFGLRLPLGVDLDDAASSTVVEALRRLWRGEVELDGLNALVPRAGLTWWQVNVVRAYLKYLRQAGTPFSQGYIERALVDNPGLARQLVELFEARFDPARVGDPQVVTTGAGRQQSAAPEDSPPVHSRASLVHAIEQELAAVPSLDQDRIIRSLLALIIATLRTNAYRRESDGSLRATLAIKLDPRRIPGLPEPRPRFEIWVYSPRVEGVHLRFGPVARGGLRWSDRREDFRTEVLGLVKAQMVKNAVIVPVGAKGGFVAKQLPDPAADREAWLAEGIACYRTFVSCLLDVTDNYLLRGGTRVVVGPPDTRRYDGDDPYLVVAADKGTATFSDLANEISAEYGFWLGDAFASGGSVGYDHKAMGITARGAWESVKYHFRELGVDIREQDVSVVGIGDMSGDVFGNGMLLSRHLRLVAGFDHRHIFLDPDPDPAMSYAERRRLFDVPRSSWADYDPALISTGGGVIARTVKSVPVTPQVRAALGLDEDVETLTPAELIHAILLAPVDLLFNGGVGTYVKASTESPADAGDKANDAVRVDASDLRCRVVGEGGNLGFTQRGRIEYALAGGRINTDAIDNCAGVDTSDHEVNLKILLDPAVSAGRLGAADRAGVLAGVTDDVAAHVLRDNYLQNVLLGLSRRLAPGMVSVHTRLLAALQKSGELDRSLEQLPSARELVNRESAGEGLTSPELAVLAAYVKITLTARIEDSTLPDEPWFQQALAGYFPATIVARFADALPAHPLHREIITTVIVNDMVNHGGITFAHRAAEETGADAAQIARAYAIVREVFGVEDLWAAVEALDNSVPMEAQHQAYREVRRLIDRATRWLIDLRFPISDVAGEVERFRDTVRTLTPRVPELLRGIERENLHAESDRLVGLGLPRDLATRIAEMLNAFLLLDVVEIATATGRAPAEVAELHFTASERLSVDELLTRVTRLPRDNRWSVLARAGLRQDVYAALSAVTRAVLASTDVAASATARFAAWEQANGARVARARATVAEALARDEPDLASVSVALRIMRGLPG